MRSHLGAIPANFSLPLPLLWRLNLELGDPCLEKETMFWGEIFESRVFGKMVRGIGDWEEGRLRFDVVFVILCSYILNFMISKVKIWSTLKA